MFSGLVSKSLLALLVGDFEELAIVMYFNNGFLEAIIMYKFPRGYGFIPYVRALSLARRHLATRSIPSRDSYLPALMLGIKARAGEARAAR